jgi:hypothetical protein
MKLTTIALASAFALSGTCGFAHTIPHRPDVRTHTAYRKVAPPVVLQPSYGNSNGSLGGYGSHDVWGRFGSYYGPMIPSGGGGR